jgi:hypothetical protein
MEDEKEGDKNKISENTSEVEPEEIIEETDNNNQDEDNEDE